MTIDESKIKINQSLLSTLAKMAQDSNGDNSFATLLANQFNVGTKVETATESASTLPSESDDAVEAFKEALSSKGALQFYQDYNNEKIEKMIEEKKAELEDKLGLSADSQPPLVGKERESALASLDDMLDAFRKQLQEKMQAEDQLKQQNTMLSTFLQNLA
jgi:pyruvate/2-oxoacid:ferredoxin oxidoreductase beta subunit